MKLPIIESILNGALYPSVVLIEQKINGKLVEAPHELSRIDFNGCPDELSNRIVKYETYEDDPYDFVSFPELRTRYLLNYPALSNAFSKTPSSLSDLEQLCIKTLSPFVTFDFEKERPANERGEAASKYFSVYDDHFPVVVQIKDSTPINPYNNFYRNVIQAEMKRVKLALLDFAQKTQSDSKTFEEVKDTIILMNEYIIEAKHKTPVLFEFSLTPLHEVNNSESEKKIVKYNIFPLLQKYLIKTILEIEILFHPIFGHDPFQELDDLSYSCFMCQPSLLQKHYLQAAVLIHNAQHDIEANDIDALIDLHPKFVQTLPFITDNTSYIKVFQASENAIYLKDNTDLCQLTDDKWCKTKFSEKKKAIEQKISTLTNPREIQSILEDELLMLDLFADNVVQMQSIPRRMHTWLSKQLHVIEQNADKSFTPITHEITKKEPSQTPSSEAVLAFKYTKLQTDSKNINDLFVQLKRHGAIPKGHPIIEFKHLFSGISVASPIPWIGNKSDLYYLFNLLSNKHGVLKKPNNIGLWEIVDASFVDASGNHFGSDCLRTQKIPKKTKADIEYFADLMA